jgi:tetratricopeptide (TPR) repeat protein
MRILITALLTSAIAAGTTAQNAPRPHANNQDETREHYDAAYRLQDAGNFRGADAEHRSFLAAALHKLANGYAGAGNYAHAAPIYDEAIAAAPEDLNLRKDAAAAALDAQNPQKAQELLEEAVDHAPATLPRQERADADRILGRALLVVGHNKDAEKYTQAALALDPTFENLYVTASTELEADSPDAAEPFFARIITTYGDTAENHMAVGRAYAVGKFPDKALIEYRKALALSATLPGLHYSLGATYMSIEPPDNTRAEEEFRKEIALHPHDPLPYPQLARILQQRNNTSEAILYLKRATELAPLNPDNFIELGHLYYISGQKREAEAAFRQAIAVTLDPSHNRFAIQRAYYELGQLLTGMGQQEQGRQELVISAQMLDQKRQQDESIMSGGKYAESLTQSKTHSATPGQLAELRRFESQMAPLLAGSYNNLGVHAAMAGDFPHAEANFQLAARWNPALPGVNSNWGRAAYAAGDYAGAVAPLERALASNPDDGELRNMLGACRQHVAQ